MPTMKVMQIQDSWSPDNIRLAERPTPEAGPGEVLLRMEAASLNYRDYVMARGGYGRRGGALPLVPCSDGAGRVIAVGPGVSRVAVGDLACPIFAQTWWSGPFRESHWAGTLGGPRDGVMQEFMALSQEGVVRAPRHLDAVQAATLPCAAVTAWNAARRAGPGQGRATSCSSRERAASRSSRSCSPRCTAPASSRPRRATRSSSACARWARTTSSTTRPTPTGTRWRGRSRTASGVDLVVEVAGTLDASVRAVRTSGTVALIGVLAGAAAQLNLGAGGHAEHPSPRRHRRQPRDFRGDGPRDGDPSDGAARRRAALRLRSRGRGHQGPADRPALRQGLQPILRAEPRREAGGPRHAP